MHLVMFDIDGTLTNSENIESEIFFKVVLETLNVTISEDWEEFPHITITGLLNEIIDRQGLTVDKEQTRQVVKQRFFQLFKEYVEKNPNSLNEVEGARSFIHSLKNRDDVYITFITGGGTDQAKFKLNLIGIDTTDIPIISDDDSYIRTEIMKMAVNHVQLIHNITKITFFGDAIWDQQAAKTLKYHFIAVGDRVKNEFNINNYLSHKLLYDLLGLSTLPKGSDPK